eukprot:7990057-Prorocentrum_lima.AAC.1
MSQQDTPSPTPTAHRIQACFLGTYLGRPSVVNLPEAWPGKHLAQEWCWGQGIPEQLPVASAQGSPQ